jgi:phosphoribosylformimino-5-aminoimidazole carboxamide ribotide isomerase
MTTFSIVPVLDLKAGGVVHACAGERAHYLPIRSRLAEGSDVFAVAEGLMSLVGFRRLYIADLDAIEGCGDHATLIARLRQRHPDLELWVDCGIKTPAAALALADTGVIPVLGSESFAGAEVVCTILAQLGARGCVLSLDYRADRFVGPPALERNAEHWPARVIVMSLNRVGTNAGPDFERLLGTRKCAGDRRVFAAGGVRDRADIDRLAAVGIAGALVATALHDGRLSADALAEFAGER